MARQARTTGQLFALVMGLVYLAIGVIGFALTGFDGLTEPPATLIVFDINPLHNIVHLVLGTFWVIAARRADRARQVNLLFGIVLGLVTVLGLVGALQVLEIDSLADPDNFLHLGTAALALYFGTGSSAWTSEGATGDGDIVDRPER